MRIAARRGELTRLVVIAAPLPELIDHLRTTKKQRTVAYMADRGWRTMKPQIDSGAAIPVLEALDQRGRGAAQSIVAEERQIAVGIIVAHRGHGGVERGRRRQQVGVEVLEAQHRRIGQRVGTIAHAPFT